MEEKRFHENPLALSVLAFFVKHTVNICHVISIGFQGVNPRALCYLNVVGS